MDRDRYYVWESKFDHLREVLSLVATRFTLSWFFYLFETNPRVYEAKNVIESSCAVVLNDFYSLVTIEDSDFCISNSKNFSIVYRYIIDQAFAIMFNFEKEKYKQI